MKRWDIIQKLIDVNGYKSYLELGTFMGGTFEKIKIQKKISVDIERRYDGLNYCMSTDDFFKQNQHSYDIIFIDANHEDEYVWKDINNALRVLNWNGAIVCHDCNPTSEQNTLFESLGRGLPYNGTVYRSIGRLHATNPFVKIHTVDTDWGVGIIIPTGEPQQLIQAPFESYHDFVKNKQYILNLISTNTFEEIFRYKIEQPLPKIEQPVKHKKIFGLF